MNIRKLIDEIYNFDDYNIKSNGIRIIVGKENLDDKQQGNFEVLKEIDIYKLFNHFAFLTKDWLNYKNDSEVCVWSLLLDINREETKEFLTIIKKRKMHNQLIRWLYYKHGIVMVNRRCYSKCFKAINNYNITHALIISEYCYKNVVKHFSKNTKVGIVPHPSRVNWGVFKKKTWYEHSDKFVKECRSKEFTFEIVSLNEFQINYNG